jgi:tetrahedral aminopeptidase
MADLKLLAKLSEAFGVPGNEEEISSVMESEFKRAGLKVSRDRIGNVIAHGSGAKKNPLMLGAHMDEIGLMVKFITEKGFIRFIKIGGIDNRVLPNQRVVVRTRKGSVPGVIGCKPPHLQKEEETKSAIECKHLFIDVGAKDAKEVAALGIEIGDPVGFEMQMVVLNKNLVAGKALDNRVGCYILLQLAKKLKGKNIIFMGTVQEEVSTFGKGAALGAYNLLPSAFIAIDASIAADHPETSEDESAIALGKGATIGLVEAGGHGNMADKQLAASIISICKKHKIPHQLEVIEGGATDAATVYNVRGGIPSISISVPVRYIHSNVSVCKVSDIEKTQELMERLVAAGIR